MLEVSKSSSLGLLVLERIGVDQALTDCARKRNISSHQYVQNGFRSFRPHVYSSRTPLRSRLLSWAKQPETWANWP